MSFDICSLLTNVLLSETIDICLEKLFEDTETVYNLKRQHMAKLLSLEFNIGLTTRRLEEHISEHAKKMLLLYINMMLKLVTTLHSPV